MAQSERRSEAIWVESRARWQINVQKDGKRKTFTSSLTGKKGKHEAEAKADKWLETTSSDLRFSVAFEQYLADVKEKRRTATYFKYESLGRIWLLPELSRVYLSEITSHMWQTCIDSMARKGLSKSMCKTMRGLISSFCKYCRKRRLEIDPPLEGELELPKEAKVYKRKVLHPSDMQVLFTEDTYMCHNRVKKAFYINAWRFIVVTGLRRSELAGIRVEDREGPNVIRIRRAYNSLGEITDGKTENADRYIALSPTARSILDDQRQMLKDNFIISPWMFPDETGNISDTNHIQRLWNSFRKQHGIKCTLHELRRTFVSAVKSDMPEALLRQQLGHSPDTDSIALYGQEMEGDIEATAIVIENVINRLLRNEA